MKREIESISTKNAFLNEHCINYLKTTFHDGHTLIYRTGKCYKLKAIIAKRATFSRVFITKCDLARYVLIIHLTI